MAAPPVETRRLRALQRRASWALAGREMRRVIGLWTQTLLPPVLTGALFLAIFGGALGGQLRTVAGVDYVRFVLPGLLVMTVAGQAFANCSTSLFQAKNEGYIEDVLSSPLRGWQLTAAYMSGGLVRGAAAVVAVAALAAPFVADFGDVPLLAAGLLLTGLIFSALGVVTGVWADTFDQHSFVANILITPLALVGGVFYSARTLAEPWATLTRIDPIYYLVDAARAGATGFHESAVSISLGAAALVAVATFALAARLVTSGWRLRP